MADMPVRKPVTTAISIDDPGLQDFMRHVYNTMCLGCIITGSIAFLISHAPALSHFLFSFPMFVVTVFAPLGFAFFGFTPDRIMNMIPEKVSFIFAAYSAVMGISMSCIFWFIAPDGMARMFFITAAAFAATSYYGLALKRNVGDIVSAAVMIATGLAFTFIANFLLHATTLYYVVSAIGPLTFTGIAAWETHVLREEYAAYKDMKGAKDRLAIVGALVFYLTFIGLFQYLLNFGFMPTKRRR